MTVIQWLIIWFGVTYVISQIRLTYVLIKRRRTITSIMPTGTTGMMHATAQGIHPVYTRYRRMRMPTESMEVNWGRDGF